MIARYRMYINHHLASGGMTVRHEKDSHGSWVCYSDYEKLEQETDFWKAACLRQDQRLKELEKQS